MALQQKAGKISFLRANQLGDTFGGANDNIEAEVVVRLDTHPDEAYGLQLRDDNSGLAHSAMVDLLRSAFFHDTRVTLDVKIDLGNDVRPADKHGMMIRVALTK